MPQTYTHVFFDPEEQSVLDFVDPSTQLSTVYGLTLQQMIDLHKCKVEIMEKQKAYALSESKFITPIEATTAEYFDEMLNVLPPCQWRRGGIESFYLSERISGNIVLYLVKTANKHFKFQDVAGLTTEEIRERLVAFEQTTEQAQAC